MIPYILLTIFLLSVFITDILYFKIPNEFTLSAIAAALFFYGLTEGLSGLLFSIIGLVVSFVIVLLLYVCKALGAGDVKLFAAIGAIAGTEMALYILLYSIIFAGIIGLVLLLLKKRLIQWIHAWIYFNWLGDKDRKDRYIGMAKASIKFPFMLAVLPGAMTVLILRLL